MDDRVQWVENNMEAILASAENPLDVEFWRNADKPFCFLAACFEIAAAKKSGSPINYESRIPVAQDGSNSGLQHYSAMLRDSEGGSKVNLVPSDKPADVYAVVAEKLAEFVADDLANSDASETRRLAELWNGSINRKWAKRGTMTTAYGVSQFGIKEQLVDEIKRLDEMEESFIPWADIQSAASYLAGSLHRAIEEVIPGSKIGMDFLKECSQIFLKNEERSIRWHTPLGLLVEQSYVKAESKVVNTYCGSAKYGDNKRIQTRVNVYDKKQPDPRKQLRSVAPNFIHSYDACHLMATVLELKNKSINHFAMIHDSFATHAAHTDLLSEVLRDEFVKLYQEGALEKFREELMEMSTEETKELLMKVEKPIIGDLDLNEVKNSRYFFA